MFIEAIRSAVGKGNTQYSEYIIIKLKASYACILLTTSLKIVFLYFYVIEINNLYPTYILKI